MGKPGDKVVTQGSDKNLRLVLETAEGLGMDNAVSVALEDSSYWAWFLVSLPAPRRFTFHRMGRKSLLPFLSHLANIKPTNH
jgi:hypothetical protein